jgi:hypothetical protein
MCFFTKDWHRYFWLRHLPHGHRMSTFSPNFPWIKLINPFTPSMCSGENNLLCTQDRSIYSSIAEPTWISLHQLENYTQHGKERRLQRHTLLTDCRCWAGDGHKPVMAIMSCYHGRAGWGGNGGRQPCYHCFKPSVMRCWRQWYF